MGKTRVRKSTRGKEALGVQGGLPDHARSELVGVLLFRIMAAIACMNARAATESAKGKAVSCKFQESGD